MKTKFFSSVLYKCLTALVVTTLVVGALPVKIVYAATIPVNTTADETTTNGNCSLREAIINANNDAATQTDCPAGTGADTITLSSGSTYTLSLAGTTATTGDLDISDADGLTIQANGTTAAIIDAGDIDRVIDVTAGDLTISTITVTNGTTPAASTQGGGIRFAGTGTLTVMNSTVSNNVGLDTGACGGGIYNNTAATINIVNSTIANNTCSAAGSDGGGLSKGAGGTLNITNSTFYGNSTNDLGGGARITAGTATILFSTFSNNSTVNATAISGGGLQISTATVAITSSILANNTPLDCDQSNLATVTLTNTLIEQDNDCGTESFAADPGLGALANNGGPTQTMSITAASVAYNAATGCSVSTDQRGVSRPQNAICDLGAYELDNTIPSVTINQGAGQPDPTNVPSITFDVVFSEAVTGFDGTDISFAGSTVGGTLSAAVSGSGTTYTVTVTGMTSDGTVVASIPAGVAQDGGFNSNAASTSTDNTVTYDTTGPTVTINQAAGQPDPTNASPIDFTVVFSEVVTGFDAADISFTGSTVGGTLSASVSVVDPVTYTVSVTGITSDGMVVASVVANAAVDASNNGNSASTSTDNTVTYNTSGPETTIDSNPPNPSSSADATFTFSSPDIDTVGFECQLDGGGWASCSTPLNYSGLSAGSHTFEVRAIDASSNVDLTPASYIWTIDLGFPTVTSSTPANNATLTTGPTQLIVQFSEDVKNDGSAGAANNTANYLLVEDGANAAFNTASCVGGLVADDVLITINSATYTNNGGSGPYVATVNINGGVPLSAGTYRLFVCGTTSIQDLAGNELNNGASDALITFTVQPIVAGGGGGTGGNQKTTALLPATGFPMNQVTELPHQPVDKAYAPTDLWLEIPRLSVKMSIVGVPKIKGGWDVTWLNKEAGWLNGSAFPTWSGNSVLTGHVWDAFNQPGPFAHLKNLKYGDQIKIHAFGQVYTFEITENALVSPSSTKTVFKHAENSLITLITCEDYKEASQSYTYRRMVRAVLVSVTNE